MNVWVNDEPDAHDNDASIQLQLKDEFRAEKKPYIGNLRKYVKKEPTEAKADDFQEEDDDLQF